MFDWILNAPLLPLRQTDYWDLELIRDVFRIQSNIYDEAFLQKKLRLFAVDYIRKNFSV